MYIAQSYKETKCNKM